VVDYLEDIAISDASCGDVTDVEVWFILIEASFHSYSSVNDSYL